MKRAANKRRQIMIWVISLVVALSMICSAASLILPGRDAATPTAIPTVAILTWTPTSQPSPEPVATLLAAPSVTPQSEMTPTR